MLINAAVCDKHCYEGVSQGTVLLVPLKVIYVINIILLLLINDSDAGEVMRKQFPRLHRFKNGKKMIMYK